MIDVSKIEKTENTLDPASLVAQLRIKQGLGYEYKPQQGQMIGNVYVGANPMQHLAEALRGGMAGYEEAKGMQDLIDIQEKKNVQSQKDMTNYVNFLRGTPEKRTEVPQQVMVAGDGANDGEMSQGHVTQVTPAIAPNPSGAEAYALASSNPLLKQLALNRMEKEPEIQARLQQAQQHNDTMKLIAEGNNAARREAAASRLAAAGQKVDAGKVLPSGEVDKITGLDESLGAQQRLAQTFRPEYANYGSNLLGSAANMIGSRFSDKLQPQAEWWAAQEANDNIMRNKLFGASLTKGEQEAWDRTSIKPGMSDKMITERMAERAALIEAQRNTRLGNLGKAGYNVKEFGTPPDTFKPKTEQPSAPAASSVTPMFASNGSQRIVSNDGGKTWQPVK